MPCLERSHIQHTYVSSGNWPRDRPSLFRTSSLWASFHNKRLIRKLRFPVRPIQMRQRTLKHHLKLICILNLIVNTHIRKKTQIRDVPINTCIRIHYPKTLWWQSLSRRIHVSHVRIAMIPISHGQIRNRRRDLVLEVRVTPVKTAVLFRSRTVVEPFRTLRWWLSRSTTPINSPQYNV